MAKVVGEVRRGVTGRTTGVAGNPSVLQCWEEGNGGLTEDYLDADCLRGTDYFHIIDYSEINYGWGGSSFPWVVLVLRPVTFVTVLVLGSLGIPKARRMADTILVLEEIIPWLDLSDRGDSVVEQVILTLVEGVSSKMIDWAMRT